ncbi:hypothetical protein AMIS_45330 [Actinoplanes missouriensis 431]|uniref:Alpha-L-arabinofuranosidase B arabinose-binding domain-containing protein n=1 Tax=Actinoplanes missouriensis (strain ATCC 14538 / DSM 43046 / CBS 188.64 / JCM 3121 / NBRC 102363 / NCIMB 12654 / NRRL B-3342 / UNCC 431) TaxID=512565 RepID=I0H9R6_ACTM4|nr:AbfB domain-containing protein [Actinoplanes missouriensis]BAL89753.1 hypothetical protein AMIS_45330 [Actinoplanes missouriensis 431]
MITVGEQPGAALSDRLAGFEVVTGLHDARCFSFRAADGGCLRHASWRLRLDPPDGTELFRADGSLPVRPVPGG